MRWLRELLRINLAASLALRGAFWVQVGLMALNNLMFFCFWWVLFDRFESIRGWVVGDVAMLFGVAAGGYGLCAVLCGGVHDLARQIEDGELDPLLTQPRSVLLQAIASRTRPDGWGDLASAALLIGTSGRLELQHAWLVPIAVAIAAVVLTSAWTVIHASTFWLGRTHIERLLADVLLTFSVYPPVLFGPAMRVILFTVIPAGFISYLPVELLRAPSLTSAVLAVGGALAWAGIAVLTFRRGLRRYASGNRFGVRG